MVYCRCMSSPDIICKATTDTFVRFGIVIAALLGFAVYFFYDATCGYRRQNAAVCSYKAFAALGEQAGRLSSVEWEVRLSTRPLLNTVERAGCRAVAGAKGEFYPLPADCEAATACPPEILNHAAMNRSWSDCWAAYSKRMQYPIKPGDHPHDEAAIREQWYAGGIFTALGLGLLGIALRTARRELSLRGDTITAAGRSFNIGEIECIDLRQWGTGFKGVAYFTVSGRKLRFDGMTYGGFNREKGEPAEKLMQAILQRYRGDIIEYETDSAQTS